MSNESKEMAAKAKRFGGRKPVDLLLDNALYILMIIAVIVSRGSIPISSCPPRW